VPRLALRWLRPRRLPSAGAVVDVAFAAWELWRVRRQLRSTEVGGLIEPASEARAPAGRVVRAELEEARRWARAVARAQRIPWARNACLGRSLALERLLRKHGVADSCICIGVQAGDAFGAHAWVEVGGVVVGDHRAVGARWTPLAPGTTAFRSRLAT
jgi:hypothetical protein